MAAAGAGAQTSADSARVSINHSEAAAGKACVPFCMAVRTNMLYDVLATPDLGVEFSLGEGWSVSLEGLYAWWNKKDYSRVWRIEALELSGRRYFGRKPFSGWHAGVYGQLVRYDINLNGHGALSGGSGTRGKLSFGGGLEAGYTMVLSTRLRLDFAVGVGYLTGKYQTYRHIDGHNIWRSTRMRHFVGPTRVAVALTWVIGKGGCL